MANNQKKQPNKRTASDLLPRFFRTEANKKFVQSTIDQMIQPGSVEQISGFVGRETTRAKRPGDVYIKDVTKDRDDYQFEPAVVSKDETGNVTFYKDYNDYINVLSQFGANTEDHSRLNSQEMYAWNPSIDWDKFVNFREYYWLPGGPPSVNVAGNAKNVTSTYTVSLTSDGESPAYIFSPDGQTRNPSLNLFRGQTYVFEVSVPGYPIAFATTKTVTPGTDTVDDTVYFYTEGVVARDEDGNQVDSDFIDRGTIEFTVPENAPDKLFYISSTSINTSGAIRIRDADENTAIDVNDIIGKKTYTSENGVEFTNGLKIRFLGEVEPAEYKDGFYYVEGVGDSIVLIDERDLVTPAVYAQQRTVPFDSVNFDTLPFSDAWYYAEDSDYIVINRASPDQNVWSRYNRWFHRSVIEKSLELNQRPVSIDESRRARRPIIEFESGLRLFKHGIIAKKDVDLIDNFTDDVFSTIEGSTGYIIDGVDLLDGMRVIFNADSDAQVKGKIYEVKFIEFACDDGTQETQIKLVETDDSESEDLDSVMVRQGTDYAGKVFYYKDQEWIESQEKTSRNQTPLFDVFDDKGNSFADPESYQFTTFSGTPVFSYAQGQGDNDPELGFPLRYRSIANTGDILFHFDLLSTEFEYEIDDETISANTSKGYLQKCDHQGNISYTNGFTSEPVQSKQRAVRVYTASLEQNTEFEIDVYDKASEISEFNELVYVNGVKTDEYSIKYRGRRVFVVFDDEVNSGDTVTVKTLADKTKNKNGYYEIPYNLERNPLNGDVTEFTLGEVVDHASTIAEECRDFVGDFPGVGNMRDLGDIDRFGTRFVKHSGPINIPAYHVTHKQYNIVHAIDYAAEEYSRFKRIFLEVSERLGFDGAVSGHVERVLQEVNKDKTSEDPFHLSDMVPAGPYNSIPYTVLDSRTELYPLSKEFALDELTNRAVLVYNDNRQLCFERDYDFSVPGFVRITAELEEGSLLEIHEYESTDGSYVPSTPSKLGLYKRHRPELVLDDTFLSTSQHSTGPYKVYAEASESCVYATKRGWFYPVFTSLGAAKQYVADNNITGDVEQLTLKGMSTLLYVPDDIVAAGDSDTDDFKELEIGVAFVRGHDGSYMRAFKDFRDELLIELESRIFNNIKVEQCDFLDVDDFLGGEYKDNEFSRDEVNSSLQASFSKWLTLVNADYTDNSFYNRNNGFTFNYSDATSPNDNTLPGFWRGVYRYAYDTDRPHTCPWEILGFANEPLWWEEVYGPAPYTSNNLLLWQDIEQGIVREPGKDIVVKDKYARPGITRNLPVDSMGKLLSPADSGYAKNLSQRSTNKSFVFGDVAPVESAWRRSSDFAFAALRAYLLNKPAHVMGLGFDVARTSRNAAGQISYADTQKPIVIENVKITDFCDDDSDRIATAGLVTYIQDLIVRERRTGCQEYRREFRNIKNQLGFKLAGFSDKSKIRVVLDSRSPFASGQEGLYLPDENYEVFYNVSSPVEVMNYSGVVVERLPAGYVVRGYNSAYPYFNYYEPETTSRSVNIRVGGISANVRPWEPNTRFTKDQIIEHRGSFYRVAETFTSGSAFVDEQVRKIPEVPVTGGRTGIIYRGFNKTKPKKLAYGTKLRSFQEVINFIVGYGEYLRDSGFEFDFTHDGSSIDNFDKTVREFLFWTTQNWAEGTMITLSPAANKLLFNSNKTVVDNIFDRFYDYSLFKADGNPLPREDSQIERVDNKFGLSSARSSDGIYNVSLPLVQKEHVVLLDNRSVFNDVIYDLEAGYRRERVKIIGYRSEFWDGGLNVPGFVYDDVTVSDWEQWRDYDIGSVVRYKQFYYVANSKVPGSSEFDSNKWHKLNEKPESELIANFDFRAKQFEDFYDIDTEGFDVDLQNSARRLVGYQPRSYLANIITDEVSQFKFYQGFIRDKGTKTALDNLFDSLGSAGKENLEFYEDWAIQVGRYGAVDDVQHFEVVITPDDLQEVPQAVELVERLPQDTFDSTMRVLPSDLYDKSCDCPHAPFETLDEAKEVLKTSGYVNEEDIDFVSMTVAELANGDVNELRYGGYIWITETDSNPWDVLQQVKTGASVLNLSAGETINGVELFDLTVDRWATGLVKSGDIVGIRDAQIYEITGLYKVHSVKQDIVTIEVPEDNTVQVFNDEKFELTKMRSVRTENVDAIGPALDSNITRQQRVWVDDVDGNWRVLQGKQPFESVDNLFNPVPESSGFGKNISVSDDNRNMFVSNVDANRVDIYGRNSERNEWVSLGQVSAGADLGSDPEFGYSTSASNDAEYLAVGCPGADSVVIYRRIKNGYQVQETLTGSSRFGEKVRLVSSRNFYTLVVGSDTAEYTVYTTGSIETGVFAGNHRSASRYTQGNTVRTEGRYYLALNDVPVDIELDNSFYWEDITWVQTQVIDGAAAGVDLQTGFVDVTRDGKVVVLAGEVSNVNVIAVYRYDENDNEYVFNQSIFVPGQLNVTGEWANSVAIHPTGEFVAAGIPTYSNTHLEQGRVYVYSKADQGFEDEPSVIEVPVAAEIERFGYSLSFGDRELVIASMFGDQYFETTFDDRDTILDQDFTEIGRTRSNTGAVFVYELFGSTFVFSAKFAYDLVTRDFGKHIAVANNHVYAGMPRQTSDGVTGIVADFRRDRDERNWEVIREPVPVVDTDKIAGLYVYNKRANRIVSYVDYVDPIQGKIPGPADQEISYKLAVDPARYNTGDQSDDAVDPSLHWGKEHVGEIWWNTRSARFVNPYQGNTQYQKDNWNVLAEGASIDVYEWVESSVTPERWDNLADTDRGIEKGISGESVYGNDRYTTDLIYDSISQTFSRKYYFWVKDKTTVPRVDHRNLSTVNIANLIESPRLRGYRFVSFLSNNKFVLNNFETLVNNNDVVLAVKLHTGPNSDQNVHLQYQLLSDGLSTSLPSKDVELKWFDSLVGTDAMDRPVPDFTLPMKSRYGIQNRPRQSMFVNRIEALKQYAERVNEVLKSNLIVDEYNISRLFEKDQAPEIETGLYDLSVENERNLDTVATGKVERATLEPVVEDGRIVSVTISNAGRGYLTAPTVTTSSVQGSGFEVITEINELGQVTKVDILNSGRDYEQETKLTVRRFTVLVEHDSRRAGQWSLNELKDQEWQTTGVQKHDVSLYWRYKDWYASGFNQFTAPEHQVDAIFQLGSRNIAVGDVVRVSNVGAGGWMLMRRTRFTDSADVINDYDVIGRQNGTIELLRSLFDPNASVIGYDNRSYDQHLLDRTPSTELRIILETVRDHLFVGELAKEYNQLFVAGLRRVLSEQHSVDWLFKTSFVRAVHNIGELEQTVNFRPDSLESYEEYVNEVKPYSTKVREYISAYNKTEKADQVITDFDLAPVFDPAEDRIVPDTSVMFEDGIQYANNFDPSAPNSYWVNNHTHHVTRINVYDGGSGYTNIPRVDFESSTGTGAQARAFVSRGKVTHAEVLDGGTGYLTAPKVILVPDQDTPVEHARVSAVIDNNTVRSIKVTMKFDRVKGKISIDSKDQLRRQETFVGTGDRVAFDLKYPMSMKTGSVTVTVDGNEQFRSKYSFDNVENNQVTYTREQGRIVFSEPPEVGAVIEVEYVQSVTTLNAADRISTEYDPEDRMFGKELAQLMKGVDFGGVEVTGMDFGGIQGWDSQGWYTDEWDAHDDTITDLVFVTDGSTTVLELDEPLEDGVEYTVYLGSADRRLFAQDIRIDDQEFDQGTPSNPDATMQTITGDDSTTSIGIEVFGIEPQDDQAIILRRIDSDGSIAPQPNSYDTQLSGGDLAYETALGVLPEEVVTDGSKFVSPENSGETEELVPGTVNDTLDIRVWQKPNLQQGIMSSQVYQTDGSKTVFSFSNAPSNKDAVIVKLDGKIVNQSEYSIDWMDLDIVFDTAPADGRELNIIVLSQNAINVADLGRILVDSAAKEFVVELDYRQDYAALARVNGEQADVTVEEDENGTRLIFDNEVPADSAIDYTIFIDGSEMIYSEVIRNSFDATSDNRYTVTSVEEPGDPLRTNVVAVVDSKRVLRPGYRIAYVVNQDNDRLFIIEEHQFPVGSVDSDDIEVYLNKTKLEPVADWRFDGSNNRVNVNRSLYNFGDLIEIYVSTGSEYYFEDSDLVVRDDVDSFDTIDVYQFVNFGIPIVDRYEYEVDNKGLVGSQSRSYRTFKQLESGIINLDNPAVDTSYIWVAKNSKLLTANVDYTIRENGTVVELGTRPHINDVIDIVHFSAPESSPQLSFRLFKDMLNRTHYKRLDPAPTILAEPLLQEDSSIQVTDASSLPEPDPQKNLPGVVFIRGERIEYFAKDGNELTKLRRATLGTGARDEYSAGTPVVDQGPSKTVPYQDSTLEYRTTILDNINEIELDFGAKNANEIEVFLGGYRLRKNEIAVFNPDIAMDSPDGDELIPAEFTVENENNTTTVIVNVDVVRDELKTESGELIDGITFLAVKKVGRLWNSIDESLASGSTEISRFIIGA